MLVPLLNPSFLLVLHGVSHTLCVVFGISSAFRLAEGLLWQSPGRLLATLKAGFAYGRALDGPSRGLAPGVERIFTAERRRRGHG
jgi:hypothetical protein